MFFNMIMICLEMFFEILIIKLFFKILLEYNLFIFLHL